MRQTLFELLRHCCDKLIEYQEQSAPDWQGGIRCPSCRTVHGRCGDAIFPLYYMFGATGERRYADSARLLVRYMEQTQQRDGSWLNEYSAEWKGTTVFQLLSLCHAHDELSRRGETAEARRLAELIASSARWVSAAFGDGGGTNINYYVTSAVALHRAGGILDIPLYAGQAKRLMHRAVSDHLTADGLLLGEKTRQRSFTRVTSTVDIGYNLDMSLGAMAEYAIIAGDDLVREKTVAAVKKHIEFIYPDGSMDNSFGSRNYKWTLFGSKTAHGCQMALLLLADEDPAFGRAAALSTAYLSSSLRDKDGLFGYGPAHNELFAHGCVHPTFNRADALATALAYGKEPERSGALLPSETLTGARSFPELGVHHLRAGRWMGTVSCYHVQNAPTGGAMSYLWHEAIGPVQLGGVTKYERYEPFNMPDHVPANEWIITPQIRSARQGMSFSNLYEYDAYSEAVPQAAGEPPEVRVRGKLKYEDERGVYDCGIHYGIRYRFEDRCVVKEYELDVRLPCDQLAIIEPVLKNGQSAIIKQGNHGVSVTLDHGRGISVTGAETAMQSGAETAVRTGSETASRTDFAAGVEAGTRVEAETGAGAGTGTGIETETDAGMEAGAGVREEAGTDNGNLKVGEPASEATFVLMEEALAEQVVSMFPTVIAVPVVWRTGPLKPGKYRFQVRIQVEMPL